METFPTLTPADWADLETYADDSTALPAAKRAALEARLATDAVFKKALTQHLALVKAIRAEGRAALRSRLARVEATLAPTLTPRSTDSSATAPISPPALRVSWSRRWRSLAAAAALVLAGGLGFWALQQKTPDGQALADRFGVPEPGLPVLMSAGQNRRPLLNQAMNAYKTGDATGALRAWQALPAGTVGADTLLYYQGIFELRLHHNQAAEAALKQLRQLPTTAFRERADYYFALALWAQNRETEARSAFEHVAQTSGHPFGGDARLALAQLQ